MLLTHVSPEIQKLYIEKVPVAHLHLLLLTCREFVQGISKELQIRASIPNCDERITWPLKLMWKEAQKNEILSFFTKQIERTAQLDNIVNASVLNLQKLLVELRVSYAEMLNDFASDVFDVKINVSEELHLKSLIKCYNLCKVSTKYVFLPCIEACFFLDGHININVKEVFDVLIYLIATKNQKRNEAQDHINLLICGVCELMLIVKPTFLTKRSASFNVLSAWKPSIQKALVCIWSVCKTYNTRNSCERCNAIYAFLHVCSCVNPTEIQSILHRCIGSQEIVNAINEYFITYRSVLEASLSSEKFNRDNFLMCTPFICKFISNITGTNEKFGKEMFSCHQTNRALLCQLGYILKCLSQEKYHGWWEDTGGPLRVSDVFAVAESICVICENSPCNEAHDNSIDLADVLLDLLVLYWTENSSCAIFCDQTRLAERIMKILRSYRKVDNATFTKLKDVSERQAEYYRIWMADDLVEITRKDLQLFCNKL